MPASNECCALSRVDLKDGRSFAAGQPGPGTPQWQVSELTLLAGWFRIELRTRGGSKAVIRAHASDVLGFERAPEQENKEKTDGVTNARDERAPHPCNEEDIWLI